MKSCVNSSINSNESSIRNIYLSSEIHLIWIRRKICTNQARFTCEKQCKINSKQIWQCVLMVWEQQGMDSFFALLRITARRNCLILKSLNEGFVYFKQADFTRHQLLSWNHVDYLWIIVMFLSDGWTLILTAPIHYKWSIGEQVM